MTTLKNDKIVFVSLCDISEQNQNVASEVIIKMTNVVTILLWKEEELIPNQGGSTVPFLVSF